MLAVLAVLDFVQLSQVQECFTLEAVVAVVMAASLELAVLVVAVRVLILV
jgi:hypothetical protein